MGESVHAHALPQNPDIHKGFPGKPLFHRFHFHRADLIFRDLRHRIERGDGQLIRGGVREMEVGIHHPGRDAVRDPGPGFDAAAS